MAAVAYDRSLFLAELRALGLSQGRFAELLSLHPGTPYQWGRTPIQPIPSWVPVLLSAWLDNQRLKGAQRD